MDTKKRALYFLLAASALSLLLAVLRSVALCTAIDREIGYFRVGAPLPILLYILEGICALAALSTLFFLPRGEKYDESALSSLSSLVGSGIAAAAFVVAPVMLIKERAAIGAAGGILIFTVLFFLVGAVYFGLQWASPRKYLVPRFFLGCALLLALALAFILFYFDRFTPMNAPHKRALHLGLLSLMLAVLFELRDLVGKKLPRLALSVNALAFGVAVTVGVSDVVAFIAGVYTSLAYLAFDLLFLAFAFYLATHTALPRKA